MGHFVTYGTSEFEGQYLNIKFLKIDSFSSYNGIIKCTKRQILGANHHEKNDEK